jgi:hypothetical protein
MRVPILIVLLLAVAHSLKLSQHLDTPNNIIVGGYSPLSVDNLPEDAKAVDDFIRSQHTDIKDGKLISASRQVVAGFNYHYVYQSVDGTKQWDIIVYKNIRGNLYENGFK